MELLKAKVFYLFTHIKLKFGNAHRFIQIHIRSQYLLAFFNYKVSKGLTISGDSKFSLNLVGFAHLTALFITL